MARPAKRNIYAEEMEKARKAQQRAKAAKTKAINHLKLELYKGFQERSKDFENLENPAQYVWEIYDIGKQVSTKNEPDGKSKFADYGKK